jgi:hypothetical protein
VTAFQFLSLLGNDTASTETVLSSKVWRGCCFNNLQVFDSKIWTFNTARTSLTLDTNLNQLHPSPNLKSHFSKVHSILLPSKWCISKTFSCHFLSSFWATHPTHCNLTDLLLCHIIHTVVRDLWTFCNIRYFYGEGLLGCSCFPGMEVSYLKICTRTVQLQTTRNL